MESPSNSSESVGSGEFPDLPSVDSIIFGSSKDQSDTKMSETKSTMKFSTADFMGLLSGQVPTNLREKLESIKEKVVKVDTIMNSMSESKMDESKMDESKMEESKIDESMIDESKGIRVTSAETNCSDEICSEECGFTKCSDDICDPEKECSTSSKTMCQIGCECGTDGKCSEKCNCGDFCQCACCKDKCSKKFSMKMDQTQRLTAILNKFFSQGQQFDMTEDQKKIFMTLMSQNMQCLGCSTEEFDANLEMMEAIMKIGEKKECAVPKTEKKEDELSMCMDALTKNLGKICGMDQESGCAQPTTESGSGIMETLSNMLKTMCSQSGNSVGAIDTILSAFKSGMQQSGKSDPGMEAIMRILKMTRMEEVEKQKKSGIRMTPGSDCFKTCPPCPAMRSSGPSISSGPSVPSGPSEDMILKFMDILDRYINKPQEQKVNLVVEHRIKFV